MQKYAAVISLSFVAFLSTGCGTGNMASSTAAPNTSAGAVLHGTVHGGRAPISGAHVYLFAANTMGYGGNGIAASSSNASVSLLNSNVGSGNVDSNGNYYVVSDSNGNWTISGDYSCSSGQQVYVYSQGGNAGSGTNNGIGLLAALGACPVADNFASAYPFIIANEVTTIAAAYALAGFATDSTHISSSGTSLALTGIGNAFAGAANIVSVSLGEALATTPAGNGTVPQSTIDTLANILASCVNSEDVAEGSPITYSTNCTTLFGDETYNSIATTDTATAAIRMAQNPSTGITSLYGLSSGSPVFLPKLNGQPTDLSVGILFAGTSTSLYEPVSLAIDATGNVWVGSESGYYIGELNNLGVLIHSYSYGTSNFWASGLAVDTSGNAWFAADNINYIVEVDASGTVSGSTYSGHVYDPVTVAVDPAGNLWTIDTGHFKVAKITNPGSSGTYATISNATLVAQPSAIALDGNGYVWAPAGSYLAKYNDSTATFAANYSLAVQPIAMVIDNSNNIWLTNYRNTPTTVTVLNSSGSAVTGFPVSATNLNLNQYIAVDGAGTAWFNSASPCNCVYGISSAGTVFSTNGLKGGGSINNPEGVAIDGSGNIWVANEASASYTVTELVGAATPVVTPLVANLISPYTHPASKP